MDYDGRVLAMINHYQRDEDGTIMPGGTNAPLDYHFQPGSTWKMLMSYAALKQGMPSDATIRCTQGQLIRGFAIPMVNSIGEQNCITASGSVDGATTLAQAMAYSINTVYTGMTDASIDQDGLPAGLPLTRATTLDAIGDLGVTKHPQAAPWASWSLPASSAAIAGFDDASGFDDPDHPAWGLSSIGQGSAIASPLAMAAALQVIANDGQAKTVRIIDDATNSEWHDTVRMSPERARQVQALLFAAVDLGYRTPIQGSTRAYHLAGDAAIFDNERLLVGGKTGTAEIEDPANPLCAADQASCPPISWFMGFAPDVERIVVVMYRAHTEPAPCSAANIAAEIFAGMLNHTSALPCAAFATSPAP